MNSRLSLPCRLRSKQRHLASYVNLGSDMGDKWQLLKLAWRRFDIYDKKSEGLKKHWRARLRGLGGKFVNLRPDDVHHLAIFDELFLQSAYDLSLIEFVPDVIWDIGAHIGLFSLLAATRWPDARVLAFEPHPENAKWARHNTTGNGLRVAVVEAAASSKSGWLKFNTGGGMGNLSEHGDLTVPVVDLPNLMKAVPSERTLLKMDIEGEELNLLPHVLPLLPATAAVFVELHGSPEECETLLQKVYALGFGHRKLHVKQSADGRWQFIDGLLTRI